MFCHITAVPTTARFAFACFLFHQATVNCSLAMPGHFPQQNRRQGPRPSCKPMRYSPVREEVSHAALKISAWGLRALLLILASLPCSVALLCYTSNQKRRAMWNIFGGKEFFSLSKENIPGKIFSAFTMV